MKKLEVLYEDDSFIAVNKPPGLLSVPGRGPEKADCAVARAAEMYGWIREVHRLDQATSGILILARTPEDHRIISASFAAREIEKTYIALTLSLPENPHKEGVIFQGGFPGCITLFQRLDPDNRPYQILDQQKGKEAVTRWRQISSSLKDNFYRLELKPLTGRTHQLRLALSVCRAAIPGDSLYASEEIRNTASRLLLHASNLRFFHPRGSGIVEINSEIPF